MKIGFDSELYMEKQFAQIMERVKKSEKLYLEFGGKLFDDLHAERVLPGFDKSAKIKLLKKLNDISEIIICINANDINENKIRADYGITYSSEVERIIDNTSKAKIKINSVVITMYDGQKGVLEYKQKLENRKINVYIHRPTKGYPTDVSTIVSDEGYGANPYIETKKPLVVVTAPGPGSGKLATCLSQLYYEYKNNKTAGYAKFETFPIWNLPIDHPVNMAYEAATADLGDENKIDHFHLEEHNVMAVNYNRDIQIFPVVKSIYDKITDNNCPYKSPTDMGVNMAGLCITDDQVCRQAAKMEIIRRYLKELCNNRLGRSNRKTIAKLELLMSKLQISVNDRAIVAVAKERSAQVNSPVMVIQLENGTMVSGRRSNFVSEAAACILNVIKVLANIPDEVKLIDPAVIEPIIKLKTKILKENSNTLSLQEALLALQISATTNNQAKKASNQLEKLYGLEAHSSHIMNKADEQPIKKLGINITKTAEFFDENLYDG